MKRNRKNSIRKERIIMIASSAFVLTALTLTGIYMKEGNVESKDDGYTIDFTALDEQENITDIAQNNQSTESGHSLQENMEGNGQSALAGEEGLDAQDNILQDDQVLEDDLDYMPMEAGSSLVEIPGLTDGSALTQNEEELLAQESGQEDGETGSEADSAQTDAKESAVILKELSFSESEGLVRPVSGQVLLPYSMDASVYFATLDQYKYNPAVIFSAEEGASVAACAEGRVVNIFENEEIGHAVTLDLGSGYQATYGQLGEIQVTLDSYVNAGDIIATVAAPTKYFSVEGSNLYFELTKDGACVNPESLF
ncbi:MAG TPA: M23 family metallopeptidase [Candidatus Acetatifactor stercoripullorum]|uniref:M23 family metallopeptidase n=1 Tax=Candidatus Acetatifactor stercoripullorum TaxID=2838414 RepID=A0A9D1R468_9FIRM|nr:M23 family metallopeptidase [uncultured Acetatifactor sp.]HIW80672.1 M23 family metallopeptidase [Candidatus Acetatifactor stercoripullorum]